MDKEEKQLVREIKNYKIPQDWHKYEMGKLFNFSGGLSFSRNNLSDKGFPYLHYGDIHTSRKNYINVKNEINVLPKLNIPLNDVKKESLLKHGDVVFVDASEDYEGTSKCVVIENNKNVPFVSGLHTIIAKSKDEIVRNNYKKYCFENWDIKRQFAFYVTGISVFGLNKTNIARIVIPVPPLLEQQKIAEILSTCDKVIELKEKLIEQKKFQKKYLMQALLDSKSPNFRRLSGFGKEWKEVKLGSLGKTYGGLNGKNKNDFGTGKPYIPYVNIFNNSIININSFEYVEIGKNENQNRVKSGDIFFTTSSETPEEVGMSSVVLENIDELYLNSFCFGFRLYDFSKLNPNFAVYFFRSNIFRKILNKLAQGSTRFNLSKNNMMKTNIILPTIREQTAIAKIISMADQGMEFLEKELEQQKLKKKALMQLLLTGKVRVNVS